MLLLGSFVQQRAFLYLLPPTKALETRRPLGCYRFYTSVTWWHWVNMSEGIIWNVSHESHLAEDHLGNCHWSLGWKPSVLASDISCCTACRSQMRGLPGCQLSADLPQTALCVSVGRTLLKEQCQWWWQQGHSVLLVTPTWCEQLLCHQLTNEDTEATGPWSHGQETGELEWTLKSLCSRPLDYFKQKGLRIKITKKAFLRLLISLKVN